MHSNDKQEMPSDDAKSISVTDDFVEIEYVIDYRGKDNGYHQDSTVIMKIVAKHDRTVIGICEKEWTEIAPGIETHRLEESTRAGCQEHAQKQSIRIYRFACPVRVQLRYMGIPMKKP